MIGAKNPSIIETLKDYLHISQDKARIERYSKQDDGAWLLIDAIGLDTSIEIPSISCTLALADVYENVEFGEDEADK